MGAEILAVDTTVKNNAQLLERALVLGYLPGPAVLDATYGKGRFWSKRTFEQVIPVRNDLYAEDDHRDRTLPAFARLSLGAEHESLQRYDYTQPAGNGGFPHDWAGCFGSVVLDPPYKLNGTSTGRGASAADAGYGVGGEYRPVGEKMADIYLGMYHCERVLDFGGFLLVKCQDQVVSGKVVWQTHAVARHGADLGLTLVDQLHLVGHRPQPAGRRQLHARRNYSTLMVFQKGKR